jgi:putative transposase
MRKGRFTEEQMVAIIREADREPVPAVAKRHSISEQTIYTWRKRFGGFQAHDVRRLKQLDAENARLKKLVVERDLEIEVMKEVAAKTGERAGSSPSSCVWRGARSLHATSLHAVFGGPIGVELLQPQSGEGHAGG